MRTLVALALVAACGSNSSRIVEPVIPDTVNIATPLAWTAEGMAYDTPATYDPAVAAVRLDPPAVVAVGQPPVPPVGTPGVCDTYRPAVEAAGLPWWFFGPVMWRESHCFPTAFRKQDRDWSLGLFQINTLGSLWGEIQWRCGVTVREQLFDPQTNINCAAALYRAYQFRPWS